MAALFPKDLRCLEGFGLGFRPVSALLKSFATFSGILATFEPAGGFHPWAMAPIVLFCSGLLLGTVASQRVEDLAQRWLLC
jgi:hypothetical protein